MKFIDHEHYVGNHSDDVSFGYTKRTGGQSSYPSGSFNMALYIGDDSGNVHAHQDLLASEIGWPPESWVLPIQKHGGNIREVTPADQGSNIRTLTDGLHDVDGVYTYDRDILLTMNYADCVPVYIWSRTDSFTALVHAGWRGTAENITGRMIQHYRGSPSDLVVVVGVAINGACYTVDDTIIRALEAAGLPEGAARRGADGHDLDLKSVNRHHAEKAGVPAGNIHVTDIGTENLEQFFSYRMEAGKTGRALAFIGRKKDND